MSICKPSLLLTVVTARTSLSVRTANLKNFAFPLDRGGHSISTIYTNIRCNIPWQSNDYIR